MSALVHYGGVCFEYGDFNSAGDAMVRIVNHGDESDAVEVPAYALEQIVEHLKARRYLTSKS